MIPGDDSLTIQLRCGGCMRLTVAGWLSMDDDEFAFVLSLVRQMRDYQAETERLDADQAKTAHADGCLLWQFAHKGACEIASTAPAAVPTGNEQ